MDWKSKIGGGFAYQTAPFAVHPLDNQRAYELLPELRAADATWKEVETAVREYLATQGVRSVEFIDEQVTRVEGYYRPWLRH